MSFEEKVTYYDPSETEEFVVLPKVLTKLE